MALYLCTPGTGCLVAVVGADVALVAESEVLCMVAISTRGQAVQPARWKSWARGLHSAVSTSSHVSCTPALHSVIDSHAVFHAYALGSLQTALLASKQLLNPGVAY